MLERKRSEAACRVEIIDSPAAGPEETVDRALSPGSPTNLQPALRRGKAEQSSPPNPCMSLGVFILNILLTALLAVTGLVTYAVSICRLMLLWTLPVCLMTYRALGDG